MPLLDLFWTMLIIFLFFMWIWLLVILFTDIFRRHDLSGWGKAGWTIFLIILPFLAALIYVIANGDDMAKRRLAEAQDAQAAQAAYIRQVASSSPADELEKLSGLHDAGKLTDEEFAAQKAKILT